MGRPVFIQSGSQNPIGFQLIQPRLSLEKLQLIRVWYIRFAESASMGILRSFSDSKHPLGRLGGLGVLGGMGRSLVVSKVEISPLAQTVNPD